MDQDKYDWDQHVKKNPQLKNKRKVLSWAIQVEWSDGTVENLNDLPNGVAHEVD